jgi:MGT family glycosyltransferase
VLAVGGVDPAALGPIPPNVEVHAHVPQLAVLRRARVFVTPAGMGSTMESLYFGVPMVAVPQMAEQRVNADRVAEAGGATAAADEVEKVLNLRS